MAALAQHGRILVVDDIECSVHLAGKRDSHWCETHAEGRRGVRLGESLDRVVQHLVVRIGVDAELRVPAPLGRSQAQVAIRGALGVVLGLRGQSVTGFAVRAIGFGCTVAVECLAGLLGDLLRLGSIASEQMTDASGNPGDHPDGVGGHFHHGVHILLYSAGHGFQGDFRIGGLCNGFQCGDLTQPDYQGATPVRTEGPKATLDDVVMHQAVAAHRVVDVKVRTCDFSRGQAQAGRLLRDGFEVVGDSRAMQPGAAGHQEPDRSSHRSPMVCQFGVAIR